MIFSHHVTKLIIRNFSVAVQVDIACKLTAKEDACGRENIRTPGQIRTRGEPSTQTPLRRRGQHTVGEGVGTTKENGLVRWGKASRLGSSTEGVLG